MNIVIWHAALTIAACTLCCSGPAAAQVYKWVDERGVVNYSNTAPRADGPAKAVAVQERVSYYTPLPPVADPMRPSNESDSVLRERVDQLEQALRDERIRRQQDERAVQERRQRAYDACVLARRVDCDRVWTDPLDTTERVVVGGARVVRPNLRSASVAPAPPTAGKSSTRRDDDRPKPAPRGDQGRRR